MYLTETELSSWGWRIPFAIGAAGALLRSLAATIDGRVSNQFQHMSTSQRQSAGTIRALLKYSKQILTVVGLTARRHYLLLYLHNLHAKIHDQFGWLAQKNRGVNQLRRPLHLHVPSTFGGLHIRSHRPTLLALLFRDRQHGLDGPTILADANHQNPIDGIPANVSRPHSCHWLYIHQCDCESGVISNRNSCTRRWFSVRPDRRLVSAEQLRYIALWFKKASTSRKLLLHLCFAMCAY